MTQAANAESANSKPAYGLRAVPRGIWVLGFVSMFMDISSEMIHSLLPVFMVTTLGASALSVGLIEGIAEATASITKIFSGVVSDILGRRKLLAVIGYGLASLTRPLFPLASSVPLVLTARFIDRLAKGIRGAPRDALVADIAPPHLRGASYGLRQSLDTIGAFTGPLLAIILMSVLADDIRKVFWLAAIPAAIAVLLLIVGVEEPAAAVGPKREARSPFRWGDLKHLRRSYWSVVAVGGILTLARFSEAFLVLRAQAAGLEIAYVPMVLVIMSFVYSLSSYPAGVLADRLDHRNLLAVGIIALIAADVTLALLPGLTGVMIGVALWGLHMGLTQGLLATMVADASPAALRGSAFGIFNLITGVLLLVASALAGLLWDIYGASATFLTGAAFAGAAIVGLRLLGRS